MRELKFRAWRNIDGRLRRYVFSPFAYEYPEPDEPVFHAEHDVNDIRDFMPLADIIEQYTGLKDKNGKEIYEGDILDDGIHICKITGLLHPWDSPGKSTGVGHQCLLQEGATGR